MAFVAQHRERSHVSGFDLRKNRSEREHAELDVAGHDIIDGRAGATIARLIDFNAGSAAQQFECKMLRRPSSDVCEVEAVVSFRAFSTRSWTVLIDNFGLVAITIGTLAM